VTLADQENQQQESQTAQISGTVQIQPQGGQKPKPEPEPEAPEKSGGRKFIVIGVVLLIALVAGFFYWRSTFYEDTDDAQIDGNLYQVSARVAGQVLHVYVEDNQQVQQGQLLAEIDPRDYEVALDQAKAALADARANAMQANVSVPITSVNVSTSVQTTGADVAAAQAAVAQAQRQEQAASARVAQAQANATKAQLDVDRYTPLVQKDVISKQQYDAAVATAAAAKAALAEAQAQVTAQQDAIRQAQQKLSSAQSQASQSSKTAPQQVAVQRARASAAGAAVQEAQARVDQAQLNLSYTQIKAPTAGIVNKKSVVEGANLSVGQDVLTIIPLTNLWVTANFKETQVGAMHPCQRVEIKVDALGGRKFAGQVTQIGGATGSRLSLFPPENATGNYVKVVQRIPVRIDFTNLQQEDRDYALRPGYSVTPKVTIKGDGSDDRNCKTATAQTEPGQP
jgi:membrane fusion protein (multidrug efflux system)